ncbi:MULTISPECIES: prolyl-tRNA synthetase associated domain-containing protein [Fusobacterium]|uniref:prolyl-tRNA synthetase associated domain-containing protein n=1 Tax=Fusobacterium TaxID=848 RepID=UPI00147771F6|nr:MULTISPECIES: prolyl-tRNA synthetase associated domain-containing protein [Fusobacterium]NME34961.1 prolyl-tRNA synthetase associated domain-containing protein [Fusobacterium sp. FSA-380-WT-3A]
MNKEEIYKFLDENNIWYEVSEHKAVYNMAELAEIKLPYPEADAKNIFMRDDKKRNYYLITIKGNKKTDLKKFRELYKTRPLRFASEEELMIFLNLSPGSVTPFGILNDNEKKVQVFFDKDFFQEPGLIGVHPNDNTATIWMKIKDLFEIIKNHGNKIEIVEL